jgi:hypothetical protein
MVVLEQQERAGEAERTERSLAQWRCSLRGEHVFVKLGPPSDGKGANVRALRRLSWRFGFVKPFRHTCSATGLASGRGDVRDE